MRRQARRDTAPELALRRVLHGRGLRYRVHYPVPGLPRRSVDIAFPRRRVAVLVHGCFWHACAAHGTRPQANSAWWAAKISGNVLRDRETAEHLEQLGWTVVVVWEHEVATEAADRVSAVLAGL
jgi:DNA mismatch endonuclease (patch repair protein)